MLINRCVGSIIILSIIKLMLNLKMTELCFN